MGVFKHKTLLLICLFLLLNNKAKANLNLNTNNLNSGAITQYERIRKQDLEQKNKQNKLEDEFFKDGANYGTKR